MRNLSCAAVIAMTLVWVGSAKAANIQIGEPVVMNGMRIGALYLQAVKMDMGHARHGEQGATAGHETDHSSIQHAGDHGAQGNDVGENAMHIAGSHATRGDLHLEAAIFASADNDWGFQEGAWIPYLRVEWKLAKKGSDWSKMGTFLPMVASDGPHYGDNLTLDGPGKYTVTYRVSPPDPAIFPRHFDKETGISEWWAPFEVSWDFVYTGTGKKGGY